MQLHPVKSKVHDCPGSVQKPLHSGELASPQAVLRHSQAPLEVTAEQVPPPGHVPSQRRVFELKSQVPGTSVDVVVVTVTSAPRVAGAQRNCAARKLTTRIPLNRSVIWAAGGKGFGQKSL